MKLIFGLSVLSNGLIIFFGKTTYPSLTSNNSKQITITPPITCTSGLALAYIHPTDGFWGALHLACYFKTTIVVSLWNSPLYKTSTATGTLEYGFIGY